MRKNTYIGLGIIALIIFACAMFAAGTAWKPAAALGTHTASEYGFSFQYSATDYFVTDDTTEGWIVVAPIALKNDPNGDVGAIIISARTNDPSESALGWLESPNSGYDVSAQGYKTELVGGQQAVSVENGDWVVVNTPDNTERLSIAILPPAATSTTSTTLASLRNEMALVLNSLSFGN